MPSLSQCLFSPKALTPPLLSKDPLFCRYSYSIFLYTILWRRGGREERSEGKGEKEGEEEKQLKKEEEEEEEEEGEEKEGEEEEEEEGEEKEEERKRKGRRMERRRGGRRRRRRREFIFMYEEGHSKVN
jgi:flagellar biosynthesis/type III secretory pathway M-ring protein FliF/YscJ